MTQYGRTFASKLLQEGDAEGAVASATEWLGKEDDNPEHHLDRASALVELGRAADALPDFVSALRLDEAVQVLETDFVDDAYFSALLEVARAEALADVARGVARLDAYRATLPDGRHLGDAVDWQRRLRGELESEFVKRRLEDA